MVSGGFLAGCGGREREERTRTAVRIGSKQFVEQEILGQLTYQRLSELDGIRAINEIGYGDSDSNWTALKSGDRDLYWEYTGTAWLRLPPRRTERITDPARLYDRVADDTAARGIAVGEPAQFSNEYVVVADERWSERTGVGTLSELASHVTAGNTGIDVAVNEAFYHRRDGWRGMADFYGIDPETRRELEAGTFVVTSVGLPYERLGEGSVEVASGFNTDPQLERPSVVELTDDRGFFLPYQPAPTVAAGTADRHPEIFEALAPIAASLDAATMRRLNAGVIARNRTPASVASAYLARLEVER